MEKHIVALVRPSKKLIQIITLCKKRGEFDFMHETSGPFYGTWSIRTRTQSEELKHFLEIPETIEPESRYPFLSSRTERHQPFIATKWTLIHSSGLTYQIIAKTITHVGVKIGFDPTMITNSVQLSDLSFQPPTHDWAEFVQQPQVLVGQTREEIHRRLFPPPAPVIHREPPAVFLAQQACAGAFAREEKCPITLELLASFPYVFVNTCGHMVGPDGERLSQCPTCRGTWCPTRIFK